mmetsp:Transcript_22537/g.31528  ORF Transcript_22537/g.31528 Transcript_22537/m.31528 type:complete len:221 (-) Transcript_22537:130-792(-)
MQTSLSVIGGRLIFASVSVKLSSSMTPTSGVIGLLPLMETPHSNFNFSTLSGVCNGLTRTMLTLTASPTKAYLSSSLAFCFTCSKSKRGLFMVSKSLGRGIWANKIEPQAKGAMSEGRVELTASDTCTVSSLRSGSLSSGTATGLPLMLSTSALNSLTNTACLSGGCCCCSPLLGLLMTCLWFASIIFSSAAEWSSISLSWFSPRTKGFGVNEKSTELEK